MEGPELRQFGRMINGLAITLSARWWIATWQASMAVQNAQDKLARYVRAKSKKPAKVAPRAA
jgi:hypothetical protein